MTAGRVGRWAAAWRRAAAHRRWEANITRASDWRAGAARLAYDPTPAPIPLCRWCGCQVPAAGMLCGHCRGGGR